MTQTGQQAGGNPGDLCPILGGNTCIPVLEFSEVVAGDTLDLVWDFDGSDLLGPDGIPDMPTITSTGSVTLTSLSATTAVFDITLNNTTTAGLNDVDGNVFTGSIVSLGMDIDGYNSASLSIAGSSLDTYDTGDIAGGPGLTTDFCASTDAACNSGNEADGIVIGGSDTFQFTVSGNFDEIGGITMRNISTKWQTNYDELVVPDIEPIPGSGNSSFEQPGLPPGWVPEPSTGLLLTIGLVGLGLKGRRR